MLPSYTHWFQEIVMSMLIESTLRTCVAQWSKHQPPSLIRNNITTRCSIVLDIAATLWLTLVIEFISVRGVKYKSSHVVITLNVTWQVISRTAFSWNVWRNVCPKVISQRNMKVGIPFFHKKVEIIKKNNEIGILPK